MTTNFQNTELGILGGGQLSMLLCEAARNLGIKTHVLTDNPDDPASQYCDSLTTGSIHSEENLKEFVSRCTNVVFENEFIPTPVLEKISELYGERLVPSAETMMKCGDKLEQKLLIENLDLPTTKYTVANVGDDISTYLYETQQSFPDGFVLKWAKGGYDGGGVLLIRNDKMENDARIFIQNAFKNNSRIYAEELVDFDREVALVAVQSTTGEFAAYPLVETVQENNICNTVVGPTDPELHEQAMTFVKKLMTALELYGTCAVEFFVCQGNLYINEIAPRVHNSGHCTLVSSPCSQFENHLRGTLGAELGPTKNSEPAYGMENILGPADYKGALEAPKLSVPGTSVCWYHKQESRPGRKIGHVNLVANSNAQLQERLQACKTELKQWSDSLQGKSP